MKNNIINFFKLYRVDRLLFYYIPFFIGTLNNNLSFIQHLLLFFNFFLIFELMIILNDYTDKTCDKYNNINRLDISFRKKEIIIYLTLFIIYNLTFEFIFFNLTKSYYIGLICSIFLSLLYHCNPIRLKKIFPLNNLSLGFVASFLYLWGTNGNYQLKHFIIIGIFFTIASIYKDFKDIKGDLKDKIYTLPSLFYKYKIDINYCYFLVAFLLWIFNISIIHIFYFKTDIFYYLLCFISLFLLFIKSEKYLFLILLFNSFLIFKIVFVIHL